MFLQPLSCRLFCQFFPAPAQLAVLMNHYPFVKLFHSDIETPNRIKSTSYNHILTKVTNSLISAFTGIRFALTVCLAWSVLQYFPTLLRLGFKGSPPASVRAGLLISPHTQTWAATSCMTHVAPKNVLLNSALVRREGSISCGHSENFGGGCETFVAHKGLLKGPWKHFQGDSLYLHSESPCHLP